MDVKPHLTSIASKGLLLLQIISGENDTVNRRVDPGAGGAGQNAGRVLKLADGGRAPALGLKADGSLDLRAHRSGRKIGWVEGARRGELDQLGSSRPLKSAPGRASPGLSQTRNLAFVDAEISSSLDANSCSG